MLKKVLQRITQVIKSVRMTDISPSSVAVQQDDKGNKRPLDEELSDHQKKQKTESGEQSKRLPKRKIAMLIGYNGKGYHGIQINKEVNTIENEILKALVKTQCIPQEHADVPQKMSFQRACRTDKGVSAAMNLLSLKVIIDIENLLEKINSHLPEQIRVFGYRRTTGGFDSKNYCDNRTYMYICPTYAFAPLENIVTDEYRMTDDVVEHVNKMLARFIGTHRFHNYTSKIDAKEARAKRYIISFTCGKPFIRDGCEFCVITVRGQSFMLHHIRKMIGITIAIVRGNCGEDVIDKSWKPERVDIPKAPGQGLCLEQPHYDNYNKKYGTDGIHAPLDWVEEQDEINKFKEEYIYSDIMKTEKDEKIMMEWLGNLQHHVFDVVDDKEERASRYAKQHYLKKCKQDPNIVITPDTGFKLKSKTSNESADSNNSENAEAKEDNSDIQLDSEVKIKSESEVKIKSESEVEIKSEIKEDKDLTKENEVEADQDSKPVKVQS
ncbi:pseudouridylate synthase 1 homolog isoform X1 [Mytilus californianus]|uniref:pseudouridylate synthase 1 homolog isoform X1 n=2 Tax=Mytilus californianus TaxID=6549 RepID=UPI0022477F17|nr:pseudouridylate synthase 1 homolog isoform X1 [Mytilus californianus]